MISYPTFADDQILTAAQLNQLGAAVATLRSAIETAAHAFAEIVTTDGQVSFWLRHTFDTLHFRARGEDVNWITITATPEGGVPTTIVFEGGTLDRVIDISAVAGLDVGDFYTVTVTERDPDPAELTVFMVYEAPS